MHPQGGSIAISLLSKGFMEPEILAPQPAPEPAAPQRTFARRIDCGQDPAAPAAAPAQPVAADGLSAAGEGA